MGNHFQGRANRWIESSQGVNGVQRTPGLREGRQMSPFKTVQLCRRIVLIVAALGRPGAIGLIVMLLVAPAPFARANTIPLLGPAAQYTVYGGASTAMTINGGHMRVIGDAGLGPAGSLDFSGGSVITGRLDRDPSSTLTVNGNSQALGGIHVTSMSAVNAAIVAAAAAAAANTPDQTIASLGNGSSLTGNGGLKTIRVTGSVNLNAGGILTLRGGPSDFL